MTTATAPKPPRNVRSATILFGLVAIPTKFYTSREREEKGSAFHLHHAADGGRLRQKRTCEVCEQAVEDEDTVKGIEVGPGQHVLFTKDELAALDQVGNNEIRVQCFVTATAVDPLFMEDGHYYLGPDKGGDAGYALLVESMLDTRRAAIALYAYGGKERPVLITAKDTMLVLHELRFAQDVRAATGLVLPALAAKPLELKLARQLIDKLSVHEFVPEQYADVVAARRKELIDQKIAGGEITTTPAAPPHMPDLIEALRASLDAVPERSTKRIAPVRDRKARATSAAKKRKAS